MCVICALWEKGKLNSSEVQSAVRESLITGDKDNLEHLIEVYEKAVDSEEAVHRD